MILSNRKCSSCGSRYTLSKCSNCRKIFCSWHLSIIEGLKGKYCSDCIIESYKCPNCNTLYDSEEIIEIRNKELKKILVCPLCFFESVGECYDYKIKNINEKK